MLKVCIAGVTCTGWSQRGKRREFSDPSERQHAIFVAERLKRAEDLVDDIVFIECASAGVALLPHHPDIVLWP